MASISPCENLAILLLDDEASFRTSLAEMLREDGHDVRDYRAPADVPGPVLRSDVDVVVTDYEMPGCNGIRFADEFHEGAPDIPVILLTAYRFDALDREVRSRPFLRLIQKPIDYAVLHQLIHEAAGDGRP